MADATATDEPDPTARAAVPSAEPPVVFSAVLTPHRSLGRNGFAVMMAIVLAIAAFGTWRTLLVGAWPVAVFIVLDVVLIWGAFRLNYRAARAFEEVHVWPHRLLVRKVSASGRAIEHLFNPLWTRLDVVRLEDEGVVRLTLHGQGRSVQIGGFLNPQDRDSFADAFSKALAEVRSGRGAPAPAE